MDTLPSVWGQHSVALIEPMAVRGRLITSIIDAPEPWHDRLTSIGFKRSTQAWLRIGSMSPAEYQFISPEISLIGLRPEAVLDLPEDEEVHTTVPYDVKDVLLTLWQRQVASVLVALSMEHGKHFTRSQAWSLVETALEGGFTPETETLFGLTFTKMNLDGRMSSDALAYANSLGWEGGSTPKPKKEGRLLIGRGESVQWADADGVIISGRLAKNVHQESVGCWVYKDSPVWAGGYVVASPIWIKRDQLQFQGWDPEWVESSLLAVEAPSSMPAERDPVERVRTTFTGMERELLGMVVNEDRTFPSADWRSTCARIRTSVQGRFGLDLIESDFDNAEVWLGQLADQLETLSRFYYGNDPIQFVVAGYSESLEIDLCVQAGLSIERARFGVIGAVLVGDSFDLAEVASLVEGERAALEKELRSSSSALGDFLGLGQPVLPRAAFRTHLLGMWPRAAEHYGSAVTVDQLFKVLSLVAPEWQVDALLYRTEGKEHVSKALNVELRRSPELGMGSVVIDLLKFASTVYPVSSITSALTQNLSGNEWLSSTIGESVTFYQARVEQGANDPSASLKDVPGVALYKGRALVSASTVFTLDDALQSYGTVLTTLKNEVDGVFVPQIQELQHVVSQLPLMERFKRASQAFMALPTRQVENYVEAELTRAFQKRFTDWSDARRSRLVSRVVNELRYPDTQGTAVFLTRSQKYPYAAYRIPLRDEVVGQSRKAELTGAVADIMKSKRISGTSAGIDCISLVDPELCALINGDHAASTTQKVNTGSSEGYEDTGVVAGFAPKDIRAFDRRNLIDHADRMNDEQKEKYLTKDLIWPRRSFEEMKEQGIGLMTAFTADLLWKAMPKKALSTGRQHVTTFLTLLANVKASVEPILQKQKSLPADDINSPAFVSFASDLLVAVKSACDDVPDLKRVYSYKMRQVRGAALLHWDEFDVRGSHAFGRMVHGLSWSSVLKEKKAAKAAVAGSRVVRGVLQRLGPDYRGGRSVTGEDFIRTFGFSGVEYGNWTSQKEREAHLNHAFDSMMDFARMLEWEPMALSLGGKLGLCIGSRGHGGRDPANAHFETANYAINLTKMRGDGTLSHEYFHAVAAHYGKLATGTPQDVTDLFAYALQKPGPVPGAPANGMRPAMLTSFHALMVAIMREPESPDDAHDLSAYTKTSDMLNESKEEDRNKPKPYWSKPSEMFARAMEVWFSAKMAEGGERNDYLVGPERSVGARLFPTVDHLKRIDVQATLWLEAITQEVKSVDHPFLGSLDMPILNTEHKSVMPLSNRDLTELAKDHMERMFSHYAPSLMVINDPMQNAGMYDLARKLIVLNANCADAATFHHEAWHACHYKLLTVEERRGLDALFSADGGLAESLKLAMFRAGFAAATIEHAMSDPLELQAYAYQMWATGEFSFDEPREFHRTRGFVDETLIVGDLFGPKQAELLFAKFAHGELAARKAAQDSARLSSGVELVCGDEDGWDPENSTLFWDVGGGGSSSSPGIRLG